MSSPTSSSDGIPSNGAKRSAARRFVVGVKSEAGADVPGLVAQRRRRRKAGNAARSDRPRRRPGCRSRGTEFEGSLELLNHVRSPVRGGEHFVPIEAIVVLVLRSVSPTYRDVPVEVEMSDECVRPRRRSEIDQGDAIVDIDRMSFDNSQASRVATDHFGGYPPGKRSDNRVREGRRARRVREGESPAESIAQSRRFAVDVPHRAGRAGTNSGRTLRLRYLSISPPRRGAIESPALPGCTGSIAVRFVPRVFPPGLDLVDLANHTAVTANTKSA